MKSELDLQKSHMLDEEEPGVTKCGCPVTREVIRQTDFVEHADECSCPTCVTVHNMDG